jgi:hypothetical protein
MSAACNIRNAVRPSISMRTKCARWALVIPLTLAFLAVSTAALAHIHADSNSVDESHCPMCMAVHSSTHVVDTPSITFAFTEIYTPLLTSPQTLFLSVVWDNSNHDRAPPSL